MLRTVQGSSREDMRRVLLRSGRIRVLLLDPSNDELLAQAASKHRASLSPERLRARILGTLDEVASLRDGTGGQLEIRVASFALTAGINAVDAESPDGILVVQHYEHKPPEEAAPIICLKRTDGFWFSHFAAEAERMWEDGTPWPLSPAQALARTPRPVFREAFGADLEQSMDHARDLLITGVARNTLLTSNYKKFENWLRRGCRIRFLLIDPSSDHAVSCAADRYYAQRSTATLRERINQTLGLLDGLQHSTRGALSVHLTSYPLAMGIIAVDSTSMLRSGTSAIFAEYYTYQAAGNRSSSCNPPMASGLTMSSAKPKPSGPLPMPTRGPQRPAARKERVPPDPGPANALRAERLGAPSLDDGDGRAATCRIGNGSRPKSA